MNSKTTKIFEAKFLGIRRPMDKLGRLVIPKEMRTFFDLEYNSMIEIYQTDKGILLVPVEEL